MNNQFDELTKSLAQSVPRPAALKKLGLGLSSMAICLLSLFCMTIGPAVATGSPSGPSPSRHFLTFSQ
jgi:hypothetical protein